MKGHIKRYFEEFVGLLGSVEVTSGRAQKTDLASAIEKICGSLKSLRKADKKVIFIGNGGSAGISSHMAGDFLKNGRVRTLSFGDASLLTCMANDYGYEHVYEKPLKMMADNGDILFAISSSGRSENILRAVGAAKKLGMTVITLSGFKKDNPLRKMGDINFYVPSGSYGHVESAHQVICQSIVDTLMNM